MFVRQDDEEASGYHVATDPECSGEWSGEWSGYLNQFIQVELQVRQVHHCFRLNPPAQVIGITMVPWSHTQCPRTAYAHALSWFHMDFQFQSVHPFWWCLKQLMGTVGNPGSEPIWHQFCGAHKCPWWTFFFRKPDLEPHKAYRSKFVSNLRDKTNAFIHIPAVCPQTTMSETLASTHCQADETITPLPKKPKSPPVVTPFAKIQLAAKKREEANSKANKGKGHGELWL